MVDVNKLPHVWWKDGRRIIHFRNQLRPPGLPLGNGFLRVQRTESGVLVEHAGFDLDTGALRSCEVMLSPNQVRSLRDWLVEQYGDSDE